MQVAFSCLLIQCTSHKVKGLATHKTSDPVNGVVSGDIVMSQRYALRVIHP